MTGACASTLATLEVGGQAALSSRCVSNSLAKTVTNPANERAVFFIALLLALVPTALLFAVFNASADSSLRTSVRTIDLSRVARVMAARDEGTAEQFRSRIQRADTGDGIDAIRRRLEQTLLYGDPKAKSWFDATSWVVIVEPSTVPKTKLIGILMSGAGCASITGRETACVSGDWDATIEQELALAVGPPLDAMRDLEMYKWRRYINGRIQFLTILPFFLAVLLVIAQVLRVRYESSALAELEGTPPFDGPPEQRVVKDAVGKDVLAGPEQSWPHSQTLRVARAVTAAFRLSGTMEGTIRTLAGAIDEWRQEADSSQAMVRYLSWVIPSVGFIGTVVGIGDALDNAHKIIGAGDDAAYRQEGAIQAITAHLGTAFDTTLVALLLSVVLYLLVHAVNRYEENHISRVARNFDDFIERLEVTSFHNMLEQWVHDEIKNMKIELVSNRRGESP